MHDGYEKSNIVILTIGFKVYVIIMAWIIQGSLDFVINYIAPCGVVRW